MSERHVVRCDADECGVEEDLTVSVGTQTTLVGVGLSGMGWPTTNYSVPLKWKKIDGKHFCSWDCVGKYAVRQLGSGFGDQR